MAVSLIRTMHDTMAKATNDFEFNRTSLNKLKLPSNLFASGPKADAVSAEERAMNDEITKLEVNFERLLSRCQEYVYRYATKRSSVDFANLSEIASPRALAAKTPTASKNDDDTAAGLSRSRTASKVLADSKDSHESPKSAPNSSSSSPSQHESAAHEQKHSPQQSDDFYYFDEDALAAEHPELATTVPSKSYEQVSDIPKMEKERFTKYLFVLRDMLDSLQKLNRDPKVNLRHGDRLLEYARKIDFLSDLIDTEKLSMFHDQDVSSAPSGSTLDALRSTSTSSRPSISESSSRQWKFTLGPILDTGLPFATSDEKGDDAVALRGGGGGGNKEKLQEMEVQRFRKNAVRRQIRNELFAPQDNSRKRSKSRDFFQRELPSTPPVYLNKTLSGEMFKTPLLRSPSGSLSPVMASAASSRHGKSAANTSLPILDLEHERKHGGSSLETPATRKSLSRTSFPLSPDSTGSVSDFGTPFSPTDDEKREMRRSFDMDQDLSFEDASAALERLRKKREKRRRNASQLSLANGKNADSSSSNIEVDEEKKKQEVLTNEVVEMTDHLKKSAMELSKTLEGDKSKVEKMEKLVDGNLSATARVNTKLNKHVGESWKGMCSTMFMFLIVAMLFVSVFLVIKLFPVQKR